MSSLRPMHASDLLKFNSTNLDPLTETYGVDYYLNYLIKWPHLCRVMEDMDGKIEGYIIGKLESSPDYLPRNSENYLPWHAHITALTVAPGSRRLGHAKRLTEALEQVADEANAYFVDLYVRAENTVAQKLYEGMGYSTFRVVVDYYNNGSDALDMRKPLKRDKDRLESEELARKPEARSPPPSPLSQVQLRDDTNDSEDQNQTYATSYSSDTGSRSSSLARTSSALAGLLHKMWPHWKDEFVEESGTGDEDVSSCGLRESLVETIGEKLRAFGRLPRPF